MGVFWAKIVMFQAPCVIVWEDLTNDVLLGAVIVNTSSRHTQIHKTRVGGVSCKKASHGVKIHDEIHGLSHVVRQQIC